MNEFTRILERIDIEHIASYFLYGAEPITEITGTYEERIDASYKEIYKKIEVMFPDLDTKEELLNDAIFNFAIIHSDVYLQVGVMIGFQLYKVLEQGYHGCKEGELEEMIKKCKPCNTKMD